MACLPWLIRTRFWVPRNFFQVNKYWEILSFYHEIVCWVYSLELPHWGNSNEYTQHTIIRKKIKKLSLNYSPFVSCPSPRINPQWLELPISRTNFHGPKEVWAIEVLLYTCSVIHLIFLSFFILLWKTGYLLYLKHLSKALLCFLSIFASCSSVCPSVRTILLPFHLCISEVDSSVFDFAYFCSKMDQKKNV